MENEQAAGLLKKAYEKLKASDTDSACSLMEQALDIDYENEEIKHALKCVHWWLEHTRRIDEIKKPLRKGRFFNFPVKTVLCFSGAVQPNIRTVPIYCSLFCLFKSVVFF